MHGRKPACLLHWSVRTHAGHCDRFDHNLAYRKHCCPEHVRTGQPHNETGSLYICPRKTPCEVIRSTSGSKASTEVSQERSSSVVTLNASHTNFFYHCDLERLDVRPSSPNSYTMPSPRGGSTGRSQRYHRGPKSARAFSSRPRS